jgi:hypothetical protein
MSVILNFTGRTARERPPIGSDETRGEILFFTGVRIERHVEEPVDDLSPPVGASSRAAKGGRRRKA